MHHIISNDYIPRTSHIYTTNNGEYYAQAKINKSPLNYIFKIISLLKLIHTDLYDNKNYLIGGGKRYFITFIFSNIYIYFFNLE